MRIARRAGADLFIALHADTAGAEAATHGASVYTLSDHGVTRVSQVLDGHEWFNRAARNDPAINGILLDLTQRSTPQSRSNEFATEFWSDRLGARSRPFAAEPPRRGVITFCWLRTSRRSFWRWVSSVAPRMRRAHQSIPFRETELMDAVAAAIDGYFGGDVRLVTN